MYFRVFRWTEALLPCLHPACHYHFLLLLQQSVLVRSGRKPDWKSYFKRAVHNFKTDTHNINQVFYVFVHQFNHLYLPKCTLICLLQTRASRLWCVFTFFTLSWIETILCLLAFHDLASFSWFVETCSIEWLTLPFPSLLLGFIEQKNCHNQI